MIELANWDSIHFGFKVGYLMLDGFVSRDKLLSEIRRSKDEDYRLLYLKGVELADNIMIDNMILADVQMHYEKFTDEGSNKAKGDIRLESLLNQPVDADLVNLAFESGEYSRFKTDTRLPDTVFYTLYRQWITDSLNGEIATDVLAVMHEGKAISVITYKEAFGVVDIGLVAVDRFWRGHGVGTRMMQSFLNIFKSGTLVRVTTQERNKVACRFYERNGFVLKTKTNIYHIWNK